MAPDRSMAILVVADYQTTVCIVTDLLRQIGYADIDVAGSAAAALAKLRGKAYGLIIADWWLEHAPASELLAEMRAGPRLDRTPVLMLAPQSQAANVAAAMAAGGSYLFKPFNASTLQSKIEAALAAPPAVAANFTTPADVLLPLA
jgi:two-component system chemotaxis response regulator CheY